jgi:hypothetical protein
MEHSSFLLRYRRSYLGLSMHDVFLPDRAEKWDNGSVGFFQPNIGGGEETIHFMLSKSDLPTCAVLCCAITCQAASVNEITSPSKGA